MSNETDKIQQTKEITNKISPTFCLAKWHHTTIYLHTGKTHSCYHPAPHEIPLEEIEANPAALHNTIQKKKERALMLIGEKPKGCQYCWNVEALSDTHISDRHERNAGIYNQQRLDEIVNSPWDANINPEYIELAFSNECNFKCGYCHPLHSSSFRSEIKNLGPYENVKNHSCAIDWFEVFEEETNPYVKAWWKWWPEVSKTLNILRLTGGEPLMHRSTWRMFDELQNEGRPNLELNCNSNLGVKTALVEKLAVNVKNLVDNKKIKNFKIFTSLDSWGNRAEYIRTGLDTKLWEKNLETYISTANAPVSIMCTFNILSVTSFTDFLQKVLDWRAQYQSTLNPGGYGRRIRFDTPYLKEPLQYDMMILPKKEFLPYFDKILDFINSNKDDYDATKFTELEYQKFRRVRDYFATINYDKDKVIEGQKDFYNWFTEYDKRRKVNFLDTFPEMNNFWQHCKRLAQKPEAV